MAVTRRSARIAVVIASLGMAATAASMAQAARTLRFVSPERPPFTDIEGKPRMALDLVEAALKRIKVTATTTILPPDQYANALMSGPFDGTALGWRDSQRDKLLLYSNPYMENRLVLIGRSGTDVKATSFAALKGKKVALVTGYAYGDAIVGGGPDFIRTRGEQDSLTQLLNSSVDYVLMDELVVQYLVAGYPDEARTRLAIGTIPLMTRPVYLSLHRSLPDAGVIIKGFNSQLRTMIADRTYHKLLHVSWIRADVDGDGQLEYVPDSDQAGAAEPQRAYDLFSPAAGDASTPPLETGRYFFGGAVYNGWASVPDRYKVDHLDRPDHTHPTTRIVTFSWK
jgi:polar amino acid transport system substrate-binding protein